MLRLLGFFTAYSIFTSIVSWISGNLVHGVTISTTITLLGLVVKRYLE